MQLLGQQLQPCYSLPISWRRQRFPGTSQTVRCSPRPRHFRSVSRQVKIYASLNAAVPSCVSPCTLFFQLLQVSCGSATAVRYTSGTQEHAQTSTSEMPQHWTLKQRDLLKRFAKLPLHHNTLHCFCRHSALAHLHVLMPAPLASGSSIALKNRGLRGTWLVSSAGT